LIRKRLIRWSLAAVLALLPALAMAATTYKTLAQSNPAATTNTDIYTAPAATSSVVSTIVVANQSGTAATFRIAVRVAGAAITPKQYIAFDEAVPGNESIVITLGITLAATDVVTVQASTANLSFNVFGAEIQ